jgi:serine phosphatase RsbU (regulator of sigma subunit)
MNLAAPHVRALWFRALLAGGATLAVTMLVQTVIGYRYVSSNLLLQEARREGERVVRQIEEGVRTSGARDQAAIAGVVDEVWRQMDGQVAWLVVSDGRNDVVAARGRDRLSFSRSDLQRAAEVRQPAMRFGTLNGERVAVGAFFCRCWAGPSRESTRVMLFNASYQEGAAAPPASAGPPSPTIVEVALFPSALPASFARVRRHAAINAGTALALLVALVALAFRFRSYLRARQFEAQLESARQVQRDLVPCTQDPHIPGVEVSADYTPASHVGGDLVDVVTLPGGRVGFMLGDVSGKGISAALLMGLVQGAMNASAAELAEDHPEYAAARLNELLIAKSPNGRFTSLFWATFDPETARLRYLNAGHPPAFLIRAATGSAEPLVAGGPVLGVIPGAAYESASVDVGIGDLLVVYSDGIAEACNAADEEFGSGRIAATAAENATASTRGICDALLAEVGRFDAPGQAHDDRTLLVVRFTSECAAFARGLRAA